MTALAANDPAASVSPDASLSPDATPSTDWNEVLADANSAAGGDNSGSSNSGNTGSTSGNTGSTGSTGSTSGSTGSGSSSAKPSATVKPSATAKPAETKKPTATKKPTSSATDSSYIFKNSSTKKLTRSQILAIDKDLWGYARNEIFARHGYEFTDSKYKKYFSKKSWYKPGGFSTSDLNSIEWYNMDLIKSMEAEYASGSSSGSGSGSSSGATDSSYIFKNSSTKKLTREQILKVDKSLWPYARNEIFARHGYEFTSAKFQKYFAKKSWYKPGGFSNSDLNSIEWYNMDLIKAMEEEYK